MKKIVIIIIVFLLCFSLYKVTKKIVDEVMDHDKLVIDDINKSKEVVAKINAKQYIKSVNLSLESEMFNTDIQSGEYRVENDKIIKINSENIFYIIYYDGQIPSNDSRLVIENSQVKSATLYIDGYKIDL